ncbi:hypothetical protein [Yeosuana marina]|uniref:hypothetical protein n=1 Tax=Yeosuana marina TaxID=1565536 RepID=UPI001420A909|nr:hypothetical protein [Yeosuana marina]
MKYFEPSIVIIDDHKEEIEDILNHYVEGGIGCKLYNPDYVDGDDMPECPFSDVNLIFLDLYYSGKFDAEQCSNWIRAVIKDKSFYVLVLWTKDVSKSQEVLDILTVHNRIPFIHLVKSKTDYHIKGDKKYDFSKLLFEIDSEIEATPALEEIQLWKKSVKSSANEVIGNITKTQDQIISKLKKIIIAHGGDSIKMSGDNNKKRMMLFDALDTVLISNTKMHVNDKISEINIKGLYDLTSVQSPIIDKELNSWFHFKLQKELVHDLIYPGIISEFKENEWCEMYSIHDDEIVNKYLSNQKGENIKISKIVLLLSRPCDIAQNKFGKNLKLLSGLKISNPKRNNKNKFLGKDTKPDSIKIFDHLFFSDEENDTALLFDFRYNFSVPENIFKSEFDNLKVFNKELLSEMQVEYSSYSSRLGITQVI